MSEKLREWMKDTGTTQTALADALGVKQASVSRWVVRHVPVERVPQLAELTGIPRIELRPDKPDLFA